MKRVLIIALVIVLALLTSCSGSDDTQQSQSRDPETKTESVEENNEMKQITMTINDETVEVTWEDDESVKALADLVSDSPLTIDTSMYGGFEQVGAIGTDLPSSDINITTKPGDIMLYTGNNIVVFYGSNSWSYTRLGHIENKSKSELEDLLGADKVTIVISAE